MNALAIPWDVYTMCTTYYNDILINICILYSVVHEVLTLCPSSWPVKELRRFITSFMNPRKSHTFTLQCTSSCYNNWIMQCVCVYIMYAYIIINSKIFTEYMERVFHPNMVAYRSRLCLSKWWKGCVIQILFGLSDCQCTFDCNAAIESL